MALSETLKIVLGTLVIVIAVLSVLARRYPEVRWLQVFNFQQRLTEEQRARLRRTQNRIAGAELILLGIVVPIGYLAVKVMFFSAVETAEFIVVAILSAGCIALGCVAIICNK